MEQQPNETMTITSISIDTELLETIKWEAKWRGISRSEFVRDAVNVYLKALRKQGQAAPDK